jgi:hypothetical protein
VRLPITDRRGTWLRGRHKIQGLTKHHGMKQHPLKFPVSVHIGKVDECNQGNENDLFSAAVLADCQHSSALVRLLLGGFFPGSGQSHSEIQNRTRILREAKRPVTTAVV